MNFFYKKMCTVNPTAFLKVLGYSTDSMLTGQKNTNYCMQFQNSTILRIHRWEPKTTNFNQNLKFYNAWYYIHFLLSYVMFSRYSFIFSLLNLFSLQFFFFDVKWCISIPMGSLCRSLKLPFHQHS